MWTIRPTRDDARNPVLRDALRVMTLVGFSNATLRWFLGHDAGRQELAPQGSPLCMALHLAAAGETMILFTELAKRCTFQRSTSWPTEVLEAWDFLHSAEVQELRREYLNRVRHKMAFHVDEKPVMTFLEKVMSDSGEIVIWETGHDDELGYPPVAADIVATWLLQLSTPQYIELCPKVNRALFVVTSAVISSTILITRKE